MSKRRIAIILIVVILAVVLTLACLIPRIALYALAKGILPECTRAEYITDYSVTDDAAITEHTEAYSYKIPARYTKADIRNHSVDASSYTAPNADSDSPYKYLILNRADEVEMNLLDPSYYKNEESLKFNKQVNAEEIFSSLGYGTPDSFYNTLKCVASLDYEDYSFWNLNKTAAFFTYATLRGGLYPDTTFYIYERDDVRAIVQTGTDQEYEDCAQYQIDIFHKDHLNESYATLLVVKDYNEMLAFLNSIAFEE